MRAWPAPTGVMRGAALAITRRLQIKSIEFSSSDRLLHLVEGLFLRRSRGGLLGQ